MPKSLGEDGEGATNESRVGKELFRKIEGVIGGLLQKAGGGGCLGPGPGVLEAWCCGGWRRGGWGC